MFFTHNPATPLLGSKPSKMEMCLYLSVQGSPNYNCFTHPSTGAWITHRYTLSPEKQSSETHNSRDGSTKEKARDRIMNIVMTVSGGKVTKTLLEPETVLIIL